MGLPPKLARALRFEASQLYPISEEQVRSGSLFGGSITGSRGGRSLSPSLTREGARLNTDRHRERLMRARGETSLDTSASAGAEFPLHTQGGWAATSASKRSSRAVISPPRRGDERTIAGMDSWVRCREVCSTIAPVLPPVQPSTKTPPAKKGATPKFQRTSSGSIIAPRGSSTPVGSVSVSAARSAVHSPRSQFAGSAGSIFGGNSVMSQSDFEGDGSYVPMSARGIPLSARLAPHPSSPSSGTAANIASYLAATSAGFVGGSAANRAGSRPDGSSAASSPARADRGQRRSSPTGSPAISHSPLGSSRSSAPNSSLPAVGGTPREDQFVPSLAGQLPGP